MRKNEKSEIMEEKAVEIKKKFAELTHRHGINNTLKQLNEIPTAKDSIISTGILSLDIALDIGGIRRGSIIEIYGPESTGKSTLALQICRQHQKQNLPVLYIDSERTLTKETVERMGITADNFYVMNVDSLEEALEVCKTAAPLFGVIVIDSLAGLAAKAQIDGDVGDSHVGLNTRIMSDALPVLVPILADNECTMIVITQLRNNIGVMFGNPEHAVGGKALKYYASVRLDIRRIESLKQNGEVIGNRTRIKVIKNKLGVPFKESEFDIMFDNGVSIEGDVLDTAVEAGIVTKKSAWYMYNGNEIGMGRENSKDYLKNHQSECKKIADDVRKICEIA